jgi:hypothetical protein
MSDLTNLEKRKLERLFGMSSGYVLDFSNRTFEEFILDSVARNIYDARYENASGSKANRLRAFWSVEPNPVVAKLTADMLDYAADLPSASNHQTLLEECRRIASRLNQSGPVAELDALTAVSEERDFDTVAKAVRDSIEHNKPEAGLDRLHTFVIKYVRTLCTQHGVPTDRDKPLHSLFGEYVKRLQEGKHIESEMTLHILKSSISILESFNTVRNNQSLAHDNPILNYEEALLIFNHVASSVRFLRDLERKIAQRRGQEQRTVTQEASDEIPF